MLWHIFRSHPQYLDLKFKTSDSSQGRCNWVRVVEKPGLWMTPEQCQELVDGLRSVVDSLGIGELNYGVLSGDPERLKRSILTIVYDGQDGQKPVAFNALAVMDCHLKGRKTEVIHLGLVAVNPNYRAKGMSWILYGFTTFLLFVRNQMKPFWMSNVTQVPAIIGMASEAFFNVFPCSLKNSRRSFNHLTLAREIMTFHRSVFGVGKDAEFDEENFIIQNAYTGGSDPLKKTFAQTTQHRDTQYNTFCESKLNYERGDDFLQLGQVTLKSFCIYMLHSVPKGSILCVVWALFFALIESAVVPVFQWLSVDRDLGEIRPWKPLKLL